MNAGGMGIVDDLTLIARLREFNKNLLLTTLDAQEKLQLAEDALQNHDRFLATLAHELRNPLAPILLATHALAGIEDPSRKLWRLRGTLNRQVVQLSHLVEALDDATRVRSGKLVLDIGPVRLADALLVAVEIGQPMADAHHQALSVKLEEDGLLMQGDFSRLVQIFSNLLINAIKFTPEHGTIELAMRRGGPNQVVVTISDSGVGVAAAFQPFMFDMYTQDLGTQPHARVGSGIGLSLVRTLVELHGGQVAVTSDGLGMGSVFTVTLPLAPEPAALME